MRKNNIMITFASWPLSNKELNAKNIIIIWAEFIDFN